MSVTKDGGNQPLGRPSSRRRKAWKGGDVASGGGGMGEGAERVAASSLPGVCASGASPRGDAHGAGGGDDEVKPPRSLDELEELVAEGGRLGLRLERLIVVQKLLEGARSWVQTAGEGGACMCI